MIKSKKSSQGNQGGKQKKKFAFKIAYIGSRLFGYERQIGSKLPTVEFFLFKALKRVNLIADVNQVESLDYSKSGRTDKGVSAAGNVFAIVLEVSPEEEKALLVRINSALPSDIRLLSCVEVPFDFDARRSTVSRQYFYYFFSEDLDLQQMQKACKFFVGEHDFKNFCKFKDEYKKSGTVKTIFTCEIESLDHTQQELPLARLIIQANGFLWHMVRQIMAILKVVGRKQMPPELVKDMLAQQEHQVFLYTKDDPDGLILNDCAYEEVEFPKPSEKDLKFITPFFMENFAKLKSEIKLLDSMKTYFEQNVIQGQMALKKKEVPKAFSIQSKCKQEASYETQRKNK